MKSNLRAFARRIPGARRLALRARFGDLDRTAALSEWGDANGGTPVDRWYIESFLRQHEDDVHGRVLEVKSDLYATSLGAAEVEVLDIDPANPAATTVGDLCDPATLARCRYDAAVVTQTLQLVRDPLAALSNLLGALRPGGTLLITVPCLSRLAGEWDRWRWTPAGFAEEVAAAAPSGSEVEVRGAGNGLTARAFLFGVSVEDLDPAVLAVTEPDLPVLVTARVRVR
jgi:SAM-dependent methyltransferase